MQVRGRGGEMQVWGEKEDAGVGAETQLGGRAGETHVLCMWETQVCGRGETQVKGKAGQMQGSRKGRAGS